MADLNAKKREKLPAKDFGLPEKAKTKEAKKETGNYPMPDKAHARNAKARAAQQRKAGNLTEDELQRIDRKADKLVEDRTSNRRRPRSWGKRRGPPQPLVEPSRRGFDV